MHERRNRGVAAMVALCCLVAGGQVVAQTADPGAPGAAPVVVDHPLAGAATATSDNGSNESLTVRGHRNRFQPAPVPGAPMGPPPDKPPAQLGRYKISGDQTKKDGYDTQTGAYIAPFGSAYTDAGPVSDGLASHHEH